MIIDSHCHLEYEPLSKNLDSIVARASKNGVKYLLTISTTDKSFEKIIKIINKYPSIYGSYGIHPHESDSNSDITCSKILQKIKLDKKIIGNIPINKQDHNWTDKFSTELIDNKLIVKRIDENYGWGQNLILPINENKK